MTLQDLEQSRPDVLTVPEAASIMGVSPQFLRMALLQNKFPFGIGVKMVQNEFYINPTRFILYMKGTDLSKPAYPA